MKQEKNKKNQKKLREMITEANYDIEWIEGQLKNKISTSDLEQGLQAWSVGGISAESVLKRLLSLGEK